MTGAGPASRPPFLACLDASIRRWAAGRNAWVRLPVLAWLAWILVRGSSDPAAPTLFAGIDLAFHEIGHILWAPLGEGVGIAGGTLTQLLVPAAAGAVLYRQRDWFGVAFATAWAGIACFEVAVYAGDALARRLPLVSVGGGDPIHDWTYMLAELNLLQHTETVAPELAREGERLARKLAGETKGADNPLPDLLALDPARPSAFAEAIP